MIWGKLHSLKYSPKSREAHEANTEESTTSYGFLYIRSLCFGMRYWKISCVLLVFCLCPEHGD